MLPTRAEAWVPTADNMIVALVIRLVVGRDGPVHVASLLVVSIVLGDCQ